MKIEDFSNVTAIIEIRNSCMREREAAVDHIEERPEAEDICCIDNLNSSGYSCRVGSNSDSSGFNLNLSGCYVRYEVVKATIVVLTTKIAECDAWLEKHGVKL